MTKTASTKREVVRRGLRREEAGLVAALMIAAFLATTWLAGQLTATASGQGWPSWRGVGVNLIGPVVGVYAHPGAPLRNWPGLAGQPTPAPLVFWAVFVVLASAVSAGLLGVYRVVHGGRRAPGFATAREVRQRLSARALVRQAPRLRPNLVHTTPRIRPDQLGTSLGRDVHTGIDCFSSVRQSKFVLGPSESGKTSAVVIPEALDHDGPLLAASSRADLMAATWKSRAERGPVLVFDPLQQAPALPLVRWDPVRDCVDPTVAMRRAQSHMASVDMAGVSNGDAWKQRGQAILRNLLHAAAVDHKDIRTVLRWTYDQTSTEPASILSRSAITPDNWAEMQYSVINIPERQRAGYYMPVEAAMEAFTHPAVLDMCTPYPGKHFDPATMLDSTNGYPTLYLLAQRDQVVAVTDVLGALMDEILHLAREVAQRSENNRLDPALRLLADEATNTANLTQLPTLIADGGGRGMPTTVVVQDRADATDRWGRERALSMWGAATIRMVLPGVAGGEEMREIAAYFDEYDEEIPSFSRSTGPMGTSEQYSLRTRTAMTAAAVRSIPSFHSLVIAAGGLRPVLTELTPYYQRPDAARTASAEKEFYAALNAGRTLR